VQPTLQFVDTAYKLVQHLETSQLDWISCNATAIPRLLRNLGSRLGVSLPPAGPDGSPARPMGCLLLISLDRKSQTKAMRRFARNSCDCSCLACLSGPATLSSRRAARSNRCMWISGPITTDHDEHICHVMAAVARVGFATRRWLSDKCRSDVDPKN
jgi:hypothetical protein